MPPRHELVREWFKLARSDLESARVLLQHDTPLLTQACFCLQQSIEKTLKGVLLLNGQRPPRTHNLADLFGLCECWVSGVVQYETDCEWLTKGAVELRYPSAAEEIDLELVQRGLTATEAVLQYVWDHVPPEVRP
jgi:HEPN domain-containing protein